MDHAGKIKKQPASAAPPSRTPAAAAAETAAMKKPTTLLDAYEIECIRRELERLVLKHNHNHPSAVAVGSDDETAAAPPNARRHHRCRRDENLQLPHQRVSSSTKNAMSAKRVSPSPSPPPPPPTVGPKQKGRGGVRLLGRHAVAICSGTTAPAVACAAVGVGGGRRPRGGFREVEKV